MLDHEKCVKRVKISNASYENEIHRVNSPFNEDSKNIFFCHGGPNFGGRRARKFRENDQKQENLLLCKLGSGQFQYEILVSTPWYQNFCITLVLLHVRSNYLLKAEEVSFQAKFCPKFAVLPFLKLETFFRC